MARRPYSTDARFFSNSDQVVRIKWYPAKEPIEPLPFPSKINSLDWSSHPYLAEGVGEVFGSPRGYNGAKPIDYAHGLTPCEPAEVFRTGEVRDPDLPPQRYDEKGFPLCCLDRFTGTGGILWGGSAIVNVVAHYFGPQPAASCPVAVAIAAGQSGRFPLGATDQGWFKIVGDGLAAGYHLFFDACTAPAGQMFTVAGSCAGFPTPVGGAPVNVSFANTLGVTTWVLFAPVVAGAGDYTWHLTYFP